MNRLRSFHDRYLVLEPSTGALADQNESGRWSSKDLDPVPRSQKKWEWYHVGGFWISEGFTAAQMQTAAASITLGLNPGLALIAYFVGNLIVTGACCGSGYVGSKYSINFPVYARASFGLWGSYLPVIIRAIVAPIWFGVQAYVGSLGVQCMIEAIWPSFASWHASALPASADIDAPGMLSFVILWLVWLPLSSISIPSLRWIFLVKIVLMPIFGVALFTWALTAAHGFGPLLTIPTKVEDGTSVGYLFCYAITAAIAGVSTFANNMPDITRYAHNPRSSTIAQAVGLPLCITLTYFLGIVMAASSQVVYGTIYWNPLKLVQIWDNRAAKFFAGLLFAFAAIGNNLAGNSVPFANDVTALFPRYMNIRRGQYLCAVIAFAICPWKIEASAARFLAFISGYSVFLGPIAGVLLTDFFIVRRAKDYNVYHLYKPHGIYWYKDGVNLRAMAAFAVGMVPQLPGLAYQINQNLGGIARGYVNFTSLVWIDSFVFTSVTYYILFRLFPFVTRTDEEDKASWAIVGHKPTSERLSTPDAEKAPTSTSTSD